MAKPRISITSYRLTAPEKALAEQRVVEIVSEVSGIDASRLSLNVLKARRVRLDHEDYWAIDKADAKLDGEDFDNRQLLWQFSRAVMSFKFVPRTDPHVGFDTRVAGSTLHEKSYSA